MTRLDRRTFVLGAGAAGLTVSCGGSSTGTQANDEPAPLPEAQPRSGVVEFLVPAFSDGFAGPTIVAAGIEQRITFVVRDDLDMLREDAPASIDIRITTEAGDDVGGGSISARTEGIITPIYPVVFTPPEPGVYLVSAAGLDPVPFGVVDPGELELVQVGDPMRPVTTPTTADGQGVDPICTRAIPCPFHEVSLDDALSTDRPTALLVATPGFCQTDSCGPVVDLLIDLIGERTDIDVVHAEVYVDPSVFTSGAFPDTTAAVNEYALPFEPHLLVADATGLVTARLDNAWGPIGNGRGAGNCVSVS